MVGPAAHRASRLPPYSGTLAARLCGRAAAAILALGLACGGCSLSGHVGSPFGGLRDDPKAYADSDVTGSTAPIRTAVAMSADLPPDSDLAYARLAIAEVLTRGGRGVSAPWENPKSGARGTVTPVASAYTHDGATCHDFLASYVRSGAEAWMQGEACRMTKGRWEVKSLRPWKRS